MSFDKRDFRHTLGHFATGVVAVTTRWKDHCYGMTVNSFTSVSLDPPLILFCCNPNGHTPTAIREAGLFGVSILAQSQLELAKRLAGMTQVSEEDRFDGLDFRLSPAGTPWMNGALAWLECHLEQQWEAGDHRVLLARVSHIERCLEQPDPLLFFKGQWPTIQRCGDGVG